MLDPVDLGEGRKAAQLERAGLLPWVPVCELPPLGLHSQTKKSPLQI